MGTDQDGPLLDALFPALRLGSIEPRLSQGPRDTASDMSHALALVRRGQGSLVASLYGSDPAALAATALELADSHGRVHVLSPDVAQLHTGHGNVMPQSLHGGPGRAGGGEELGGVRALNFYHRRSAVQASTAVLTAF